MGFPFWGSDTGGYYQFKDREVFARWIEFSAFSGLMEIGGKGTHAPWDMPTDPAYDDEMIAIYRRYTRLHETCCPTSSPRRAAAARRPADRAPAGLRLSRRRGGGATSGTSISSAADLLVAPVWRIGERLREVYLPAGEWEDFWDRARPFRRPGNRQRRCAARSHSGFRPRRS